jgi:hypothetical protein
MYPSSTPPLDRGHCPRHFAGVEEGFTKWEEVLLIVNICRLSLVQFNGPEHHINFVKVSTVNINTFPQTKRKYRCTRDYR